MRKQVLIIISVALAFSVAILGVSNIYFYTSMQSQITTLSTDITNLQTHVTTLTSQYDALNTTYQNYVSTHSYTDTQYSAIIDERDLLKDITELKKSQLLIYRQPITMKAQSTVNRTIEVQYAGYIAVIIEINPFDRDWAQILFVEVIYSSHAVDYDQRTYVLDGESAYFPVLPGTVQIRLGNDAIESPSGRVTVTLYY